MVEARVTQVVCRASLAGILIAWVAKAASDDARLANMSCVHVEPDGAGKMTVVATDGRRMHYATIPPAVAPGDYSYATTKTQVVLTPVDVQFVNWSSVVPSERDAVPAGKYTAFPWSKRDTKRPSSAICEFVLNTGVRLDFGFLFDLSERKGGTVYNVSMYRESESRNPLHSAVVFTGQTDERTAVIMPMLDSPKYR